MNARFYVFCVWLCLGAFFARSASAADGTLSLEWPAIAGCPTKADVEREIAEMVGRQNRVETATHARVRIAQTADGNWVGQVDVVAGGRHDSRQIAGESCSALAQAVAVIVAVGLKTEAVPVPASTAPQPSNSAPQTSPTSAPSKAPSKTTESPKGPESSKESESAKTSDTQKFSERPTRLWHLAAAATLDTALLPQPAFGVTVGASAQISRVHAIAQITGFAPQSAEDANRPQGAQFYAGHAGIRGCVDLARGQVEVGPCVGAGIDLVHGDGFGTSRDQTATGVIVGLFGGGRLALRVTDRTRIYGLADAVLLLLPPTFAIEGGDFRHRPSPLTARGSIGLEVAMP